VSDKGVDVAAILAAVYRRQSAPVDQMAERVRSRLALIETLGECARLLVEAPASALTSTLGSVPAESGESEADA
jgi:hypothetical protein